jgi:DNA polymerase IV
MVLRKILHIDMDAFFASVEQRDNLDLRGKPVVVGGRPEHRGAVAAASYEARRYGIHSAMPSRTAALRCKDLIFVRPRFEVYREVSEQIRSIFRDYTDLVEPVSLDEAYLDVSTNKLHIQSAMEIARQIKQHIQVQTQLTASAGVSINKFLAKMASNLDKPDGLSLIAPDCAQAFVSNLPIAKFHGIGKVTAGKMHDLGIESGKDLLQWSEADLVTQFGKVGHYYYRIARAEDDRAVNPHRIRQSIGAERSFLTDLTELEQMIEELAAIATLLQQRLAENQHSGTTLTLKIKYANYQQITRSQTLSEPLVSVEAIHQLAQKLLLTHLNPNQEVRLLGLTVSNLRHPESGPQQLSLPLEPKR